MLLHTICSERPEASTTNKPKEDQDGQRTGEEVEEWDRDTKCNVTGMRKRTGNHLGKGQSACLFWWPKYRLTPKEDI